MRQPPVVANWVLEQFVSHESLAGDLHEEYGHGRSQAWYWSQVLVAVVVRALSDIRRSMALTLRAVMIGWACATCWALLFNMLSYKDWRDDGYAYAALVIALPSMGYCASGWMVSRHHPPSLTAVFALSILVMSLARHLGLVPVWLPSAIAPERGILHSSVILLGIPLNTLWLVARNNGHPSGQSGV
jgi:hypothetical protein